MSKKIKTLIVILAMSVFLVVIAPGASAAVPYKSYNYNSYGEAVETADVYAPIDVLSGEKIGVGSLLNPSDVFIKQNTLYILDSGNNRLISYDLATKTAKELLITENQAEIKLEKATGIYIDANGIIYIADSGNQCVWVADSNGNIETKITKPKNEYFEEALEFLPRKVVGDSVGNIYVQCTGVYEGLIIFDIRHSFCGFFGSEKVQTTSDILRNYFWKQFMTSEQKEAMANYVPSEIYSMDISADNFIYTITPGNLVGGAYFKETPDSIRCLNPKGSDILENNMSTDVKRAFENENRYLNFIDICYAENGFINVIDNKQGRVYQFDNNMQLVSAFGGLGDYDGTFQRPVAVECYGDDIIVLDSLKNTITFFSLTKTGEIVHKALGLYNSGNYSASLEPWFEVVKTNPNFQLSYIGIGNALFNEGEYKEAMEYYEIARDTTGYSNAYREYRVLLMRNNFIWAILLLVVIYVAIRVIKTALRKKSIVISQKLYSTDFGMVLYSSFHPMIGFDRIRSRKIFSKGFIVFVYLLLVILGVFEQQYMGKAFTIVDSSKINIINCCFQLGFQ